MVNVAAYTAMQALYHIIVVMSQLSVKIKILPYQSFHVTTLTYDHDFWVMTE